VNAGDPDPEGQRLVDEVIEYAGLDDKPVELCSGGCMSMRVYIAEKKEVATALSTALGGSSSPSGAFYVAGDDRITWLRGHLLRLTDPEEHDERLRKWSMDQLPMAWPVGYAVQEKHEDHLKAVIELAEQADELVNAGDPDPEGQRLVDEVIEYAGLDGKPVKRVLINDNTPSAIRDAVVRIEDNANYRGLSLSALARAVGDQRYGYNLTRCYTLLAHAKGYDGVLSVGRVQTPILGLVVARDRTHEGHQKQAFYIVTAVVDLPENPATDRPAMALRGFYQPGADAPLDEKGRVIDGSFAKGIVDAVKGKDASLLSVETTGSAR